MQLRRRGSILKNAHIQLPPFLVIQFEVTDKNLVNLRDDDLANHAQRLSSKIMRWGSGVWILDLSLCQSYWNNQSRKHQCSTESLIEAVLNKISRELGHLVEVRGALAWHPWQALLLVSQMQERRLMGLTSIALPFGRKLLEQLTWPAMWRMTDQLASHQWSGPLKRTKFDQTIYFQQKLKFERTIKRLGLVSPEQLSQVEPLAIKRRFGSLFYDVWQWLYGQKLGKEPVEPGSIYYPKAVQKDYRNNTSSKTLRSIGQQTLFETMDSEQDNSTSQRQNYGQFACGFPWQSWCFKNLPKVQRHMDDPIYEWAHMEPLLQEDLNRLCKSPLWQIEERVVSLEWRIVFQDMTSLHIPIYFRNPHCLLAERPTQKTALLQAYYAFIDAVPGSQLDRGDRHKEHLPMLCVASWELVLKERLKATSMDRIIFKEEQQGSFDEYCTINHLENKLRVPLDHYEIKEDWLPEDAFAIESKPSTSYSGRITNTPLEDCRPSLNAVGSCRPLYLYRQPIVFKKEETTLQVDFCERTMNKWWTELKSQNKDNSNKESTTEDSIKQQERSLRVPSVVHSKTTDQQRNYFKVTDHKRRRFWAFQDGQGRWYVHGVFS